MKAKDLVLAVGLLVGCVVLLLPQSASSIAPLGGSWTCDAYAHCSFQRTTSNHPTYQWNFGDGNFSGITTAVTTNHTYGFAPTNTPQHFTVSLIGYSPGGNVDNIVGCTVTTYRASIGGDPTTYSGTCS